MSVQAEDPEGRSFSIDRLRRHAMSHDEAERVVAYVLLLESVVDACRGLAARFAAEANERHRSTMEQAVLRSCARRIEKYVGDEAKTAS
jgi:hypothetical protein